MAITGKWKQRQQVGYVGARVDGTGWNAVHNTRGGDLGRGIATHETTDTISPSELDEFQPSGYDYEADFAHPMFGDVSDHPNWGTEDIDTRNDMPTDYPAPGYHRAGLPGGTTLRNDNDGSIAATVYMKEQQPSALAGYDSKLTQDVSDAQVSDPSQYEMQTSMRQRDVTREGSQASGRANAFRSAIASRIPGMRAPKYSGGYRHDEMTPRDQSQIIRPFYVRSAGTPDPSWMEPNAAWNPAPVDRQPPPLPDMGNNETALSTDYGYVDEDSVAYV